MQTVYKYSIHIDDIIELSLPVGAEILKADIQHNKLCLWVLIDPNESNNTTRKLCIAGTGHQIDAPKSSLTYINTFFMEDLGLVFHCFEVSE